MRSKPGSASAERNRSRESTWVTSQSMSAAPRIFAKNSASRYSSSRCNMDNFFLVFTSVLPSTFFHRPRFPAQDVHPLQRPVRIRVFLDFSEDFFRYHAAGLQQEDAPGIPDIPGKHHAGLQVPVSHFYLARFPHQPIT